MMDCPYGEFGDCSFSRFDSILQTNRHTDKQDERYTLVGVSKN